MLDTHANKCSTHTQIKEKKVMQESVDAKLEERKTKIYLTIDFFVTD